MVVPMWGRVIAAVAGGILVLTVWASVIGSLVVSRAVASRLTRLPDQCVKVMFQVVAGHIRDFRRRDRVLAGQAAAMLLGQLVVWLGVAYLGFSLLLWPYEAHGAAAAFVASGSSLFTLGFDVPPGTVPSVLVFTAAATGLVIVTLQIAYLPTLYAAFNRRETEVALLNARAGVPSWGPELLARTHYALGSGVSTIDTMPDLYAQWERWAADVAESHTTYLPLVRFRSPRPLSSWVTALLAVLDSAALFLSLSPKAAPVVPARLCLRSGFDCFRRVAQAMGFDVPEEPDPAAGITLPYEEFLDAVRRLKEVDFPLERDPADAWPDFVGWRVNYEQAACALAYEIDAVPARWSGPRRSGSGPIDTLRPSQGRVAKNPGPDDSPSHTESHERAQLPRVDPRRVPAADPLRPGLRRDPDGGVEPDLRRLLVGRRRRPAPRGLVHRPQPDPRTHLGDPLPGGGGRPRPGVRLRGQPRLGPLELHLRPCRGRHRAHRDLELPAQGHRRLPRPLRPRRRGPDRRAHQRRSPRHPPHPGRHQAHRRVRLTPDPQFPLQAWMTSVWWQKCTRAASVDRIRPRDLSHSSRSAACPGGSFWSRGPEYSRGV